MCVCADERDVVVECTLVLAEYVYKTEGWGLCVCFQVDELYEAFCIQSRLREGASRMKQAFSSSPSTKGTKESIAEVNRRYKEYTEVLADTAILTTETSVCIKTLTQGRLKSAGNYLINKVDLR